MAAVVISSRAIASSGSCGAHPSLDRAPPRVRTAALDLTALAVFKSFEQLAVIANVSALLLHEAVAVAAAALRAERVEAKDVALHIEGARQ